MPRRPGGGPRRRRRALPALALAAALLAGVLPIGPATAHGDPDQVRDLNEAIEALEAAREARIALNELREMEEAGLLDIETMEQIARDLRSGVRLTDQAQMGLEATYGIDGAGIAYELRQLFSLAEKLEGLTEGGFIERYGKFAGNTYNALAAVDGVLETIRLLRDGEVMSGAEQLRSLANWLDAVEDGLGLFLGTFNPVISAMLNVYTGALEATADLVENVIEPRNEQIREALQAAEEALGSGPETGREETDPVVEALDRAIEDLEAQRNELEAEDEAARERTANTDVRNALELCRREEGTDARAVYNTEFDLRDARDDVEELTGRRGELLDEAGRYESRMSQRRADVERLERALRDDIAVLERANEMRPTVDGPAAREAVEQFREEAAAEVEDTREKLDEARTDLARTERNLARAEEELRELEEELAAALGEYEGLKATYQAFKDCVRRIIQTYGESGVDDLPSQYRICSFYDLNRPTRQRLATFERPRTGGEGADRPETGDRAAGPTRDRPVAPPTGTPGEPVSYGPGAPTDGAITTGGLYEITRTIEPIDIVLTPIERDGEERPVTDPGDPSRVRTGPETGGGPPTGGPPAAGGGGGPPSGGGDPGGDGGEGDDDPDGRGGQPADGPEGEGGDETTVPLNDGDADEILNSPIATGAPTIPGVQLMMVSTFDVSVPPRAVAAGPAPERVLAAARAVGRPAASPGGRRTHGPRAGSVGHEERQAARSPTPTREPGPAGAASPELEAYLTSLGTSTGDAFRLQVLNAGDSPVRLSGDGLVVEPVQLEGAARRELEDRLGELATANPVTATLTGYCLEFLRQPPTAGQLFRIAGDEVQRRFAPMRELLRAAREVRDAGLLNPDSDPGGYFDSIAQWALWTVEQDLDLEGFEERFLEHTRENLEARGGSWTDEVEEAVKPLIPNRWSDIQRVLDEADRLGARTGE